ncbi:MAG: hypothetical protein M3541_19150 [Acidobacteriota bacterium]|nr:hypothetical protein [Acidobacteriota bacterium]
MPSTILPSLACCALLLTLNPSNAGHAPKDGEGEQQPAPQERGASLLTVDFAALGREGGPVPGLAAEEVSIRVGGRTRAVRSLQLIETAASGPSETGLPLPFGTNNITETGRTLALIVDDDSFVTGREAPLREAVDVLVRRLSPRDRLSLITMPYGGVKVPFTTDHSRIRTALLNISGNAAQDETGSQLACRTRRTLESLSGYLDSQHGIRETPLTVMFITGGLAAPRRDAPISMAPGMCELRQDLYKEVGEAAGAARANFYVIQPGDNMAKPAIQQTENIGGSNYRGSDNPIEGIEHLVGVTGGMMLPLTNNADGALGRVIREGASYYLATIDADRADLSGRVQQLEVKVSRPGVQLRTRPHIAFPQPGPGSRTTNPSTREMLSVATVFRDLPLRTTGYAALEADGKSLRVVTLTEPVDDGVRFASLVAALFDREGKLVSHWTATRDELQQSLVIGAMPAAPGAYRLRVAAIDTAGRSGTADYDLEAEVVQTGPLTVSSLVLGLLRERGFMPKLQFSTEPAAIGYLEMYGGSPGTKIASALEIAATLNGPPLAVAPFAIESAGGGRYIATAAIPIGALPPGEYIVRALIGVEGQALTRVIRTLKKDGR